MEITRIGRTFPFEIRRLWRVASRNRRYGVSRPVSAVALATVGPYRYGCCARSTPGTEYASRAMTKDRPVWGIRSGGMRTLVALPGIAIVALREPDELVPASPIRK